MCDLSLKYMPVYKSSVMLPGSLREIIHEPLAVILSRHGALLVALLLVVVSLPLVFGWIPRNNYYGIRTQKALSEDSHWYPINRFGACLLAAVGAGYLCFAGDLPESRNLHMGVLMAGVTAALILTGLYSGRR